MANEQIRKLISDNKLKHYKVAEKIGVSSFTFSVWLRSELTQERKEKTLKAIKALQHESV